MLRIVTRVSRVGKKHNFVLQNFIPLETIFAVSEFDSTRHFSTQVYPKPETSSVSSAGLPLSINQLNLSAVSQTYPPCSRSTEPQSCQIFEPVNILNFSTNSIMRMAGGEDKNNSSTKNSPDLDKVAFELTYELTNVFVRKTDWLLYHPKLIFEDRIRGKRYEGLLEYIKFVNLARIIAHLKFVYVRFHVLNLSKHPEDGTIRIRWRVAGLGVMRMVIRYIPDQMWRRGNMDRAAPSWYDGYSVFYVNSDNKIYKHVADRRMPDQEKEKSPLSPVVEKLKKLKPIPSPSPSPATL